MNVLLVDDEDGIREGFATWLRLKGHVVATAATCADGLARLQAGPFDAVITDWRLGDGSGSTVLAAARVPAIVMSGHPDEVPLHAAARVLVKPVLPVELLACLESLEQPRRDDPDLLPAGSPPAAAERGRGAVDLPSDLPCDTRAWVDLALAVAGDAGASAAACRVRDDGDVVSIRCEDAGAELAAAWAPLGGDQCRLADGGLELRFYRDARPPGAHVVGPGEPWPAGACGLAVDLSRGDCSPREFTALLERVAAERRAGRAVAVIHVPAHLRLWLEVSARTDDMPKRTLPGPVLPPDRAELWSGT